jgi:N utilization substance protein B
VVKEQEQVEQEEGIFVAVSRREIRIKVMQACFATIVAEESPASMYFHWLQDNYRKLLTEDQEAAEFMQNLFYGTLEKSKDYEQILEPKLQNWDASRVSVTDRVLILMGIHELVAFPEIPVRVSINEYIEIAKEYSTEKSNTFVNGLLDAIASDLLQSGKINKVGRGLL